LFKSFVDVIDNTELVAKPVVIGATGGTARRSRSRRADRTTWQVPSGGHRQTLLAADASAMKSGADGTQAR
jgi:hypothetical protein